MLEKQMIINLEIASKIRDEESKYIIFKKNEFKSISGQPFNSFNGVELYPSVLDKAAIILSTIIKDHPFYDGNKRTALLTCISFLNSCGFDLLKVDNITLVKETEEFMISIANSDSCNMDEILGIIKSFILNSVTINISYQVWMSKRYSKDYIKGLLEYKNK